MPCLAQDRERALKIINKARSEGRDSLTEIEAKEVFECYGLPVTPTRLARNEDEAVALARENWLPGCDENSITRYSPQIRCGRGAG